MNGRGPQGAGLTVHGAERSKEPAIGQDDRVGDVAFRPAKLRAVTGLSLFHPLHDDGAADILCVGGERVEAQFHAVSNAEIRIIPRPADDPALARHVGHGGKPHARHLADDIEDQRQCVDSHDELRDGIWTEWQVTDLPADQGSGFQEYERSSRRKRNHPQMETARPGDRGAPIVQAEAGLRNRDRRICS